MTEELADENIAIREARDAHLATIKVLIRQNEMLVAQLQKFAVVFEEELEGTNWSPNQQTSVLNEDLALSAQLLDFIQLENKELMLRHDSEERTETKIPDQTPSLAQSS